MKTETDAKHVTVFINSTDKYHGTPLYAAVVTLCQRRGVAGATVLRTVEGYGAHHTLHTTRLVDLTENLPVMVEIVDVAERIDPLLEELDAMIGEGLVVVRDVRARRYLPDPRH